MPGKIFVVVLSLAPTVLLAESARKVEVVAQVPVVAQVDSPSEVDLEPGETRFITIRVACNQPWMLAVQADNPQIATSARHVGSAGGMSSDGHTFTVALTCLSAARGTQHTKLATRLLSGPLVTGLPR